jgi:hypothetical protein
VAVRTEGGVCFPMRVAAFFSLLSASYFYLNINMLPPSGTLITHIFGIRENIVGLAGSSMSRRCHDRVMLMTSWSCDKTIESKILAYMHI